MNRRNEETTWVDRLLGALTLAALIAMLMAAAQTLDQVAARSIASSHTARLAVDVCAAPVCARHEAARIVMGNRAMPGWRSGR